MNARCGVRRCACLGLLVSSMVGGGFVPGCTGARDAEVASVHLACSPIAAGMRCHLLALSRDVSRPALDVTRLATWRLFGVRSAQISADGFVDSLADGDVEIDGQFARHGATIHARLVHGRPGQLLAVVRGQVYVETRGRLRPVAGARIEVVVAGPNATLSTRTDERGGYELVGVVPGNVILRAVMAGYGAGQRPTEVYAGDNQVSVLMDVPPVHASML